ncbi:Rho gtpase-activating protein 39 isoform 2 [Mycena sanguinolenta]|uniref:Rho gtpase-activating protein 39 isoform 2 n=1 Tax=Mycena sanguinolenta TaxID=230812 RepID=A0A8H6ZBK9_9AGAR|nr:Rho gtpase-activating protein 39 isoform 2 [Mycena sanguinolenta]
MSTIAIIAAGAMGSAVGKLLVRNGAKVLTNLDNRSEATRRRAHEAGMVDASFQEIGQTADWVLSILPPSDALSLAEKFLKESLAGAKAPVYVDCNAVNPATVKRIAALFANSPSKFIDAGIIGGPPQGDYNPTFYASSNDDALLDRFVKLTEYGLKVSPLKGEGAGIGDASALKMSYAGITKGSTGIFTTMILAAHRSSPATADALLHELSESQPAFLRRITGVVPGGTSDEAAWGSNFWVTLVDPQTQTSFFACPATGQVSWDPPVGNFVLPPSADGEWWELSDESRGGLPYYYQTKTGETVWERPSSAFVIPLGIIQNTALGRRLSQVNRFSRGPDDMPGPSNPQAPTYRRSRSYTGPMQTLQDGSEGRRSSSDQSHPMPRLPPMTSNLPTIPGSSPDVTDLASSSSSRKASVSTPSDPTRAKEKTSPNGKLRPNGDASYPDSSPRVRSKSSSHVTHRAPPPQSLNAAVELLTSQSESGHGTTTNGSASPPKLAIPTTPTREKGKYPSSPRRPIPATPTGGAMWHRSASAPMIAGKEISAPKLNHAATMDMSPVKNRAAGKPIPVEPRVRPSTQLTQGKTLGSGTYPVLPHDLASEIKQFSESDFARQYFSTHRTGFIFRRRVPVTQMMTWQKAPLHSPLLTLHRSLGKDAVKIFKVIQHIMGDRDRDRPVGVRVPNENHVSTVTSINASTTSLGGTSAGIIEEERWLLGEGLTHGELRDEIYCQIMKQLTGNPSPESVFKGWQLLCVLLITFPPSKNFEAYLRSFIQQHTTQQEGRVDVMAKYCLKRLAFIAKKGPRGKPPTSAEIETASDAAFNPSTFGESLDAIFRLQERTYPQQKVPIILPFLADGILALGGGKSEGIFRVPGDGDSISDLKLRIDKGYYTLDGVDDPHVLASLMKLWLRELCDPLVPDEMYNECITNSKNPIACVHIVERLPTINRRVVLFVVSFLQLFLEDKVQNVTKMTPANLALVMAPNLLRCNSDSMSVVFTNAQYEQIFVYNLSAASQMWRDRRRLQACPRTRSRVEPFSTPSFKITVATSHSLIFCITVLSYICTEL